MDSTSAATTGAAAAQLPSIDSGMVILTTAGYLFLLLGAIFLAYWLLRRFGFSGAMASGRNGPKLVSRLMLGNRQSVAVVRYRDRELILGVTAERVTLLTEGKAREEQEEETSVPAATFASFLKRSGNNADKQ